MIAVAEAARNVACTGARPRAITNNLNFGNPLKPEVYYQMKEAVAGMGEACRAFHTPVTGGNVSLYNENPNGAIYPTPTIGMVGVLDDVTKHVSMPFRDDGDAIVLLGENTGELGGSEYLKVIHGLVAGDAPAVDLTREKALQDTLVALAEAGLAKSAHDCAEGGLAVALAECAIAGDTGARIELDDALPAAPLLFGEAQGRALVSCAAGDVERLLAVAREHGLPAHRIGTVSGDRLEIATAESRIDAPLENVREVYETAIPRLMGRTAHDEE